MISAVVLTKNEEKNLPECLGLVKWCDEILVIDDNSIDKTGEIAKKFGAKVFTHALNNNFAQQHNFGLQKAKGEWVLFVDADERVSPELRKEILKSIKQSKANGFYLKRQDFWGGQALRYGETAKVRLLRLAKKGKGEWRREVHETWEIEGEKGELKNPLWHYPHQSLSEFLEHINFHSTLHAQALKKEGVKPSLSRIIFYHKAKFIQNYIFRLGFLDGTPGIIVALMMSFHSFLANSKLYFLAKKN
ncbi:glycosyltransferase family 2 protein [Candidatus Shapirobacteria bacterium]|nr:glycosyltransferase family 2 protein [Candidatus Shapirobacteria bacterium]